MTASAFAPRPFGNFLLVAPLGEDAMGRVYRAIRLSGERGFVRLRILESASIAEDAVLDAIEADGEIHTFLKNPAIARGVQMDAVDGTPFLAWSEASGRTLDSVLARLRDTGQALPVEHGLLIAEKVATALDHAYNTTVDGERTLHGLVWPGFVSISDDGEVRLTGFGLAAGFFPSLSRPAFAQEIGPYLPREERQGATIGRNSDVYSVGAMLFELLTGRVPMAADPLADLKVAAERLPPEITEVLRMALSEPAARYQTAGELRRELGKLLFSGPYAPSTFNLAFFLHSLFAVEIDAENAARAAEAALEPPPVPQAGPPSRSSPPTVAAPPAAARRRAPIALGSGLLVAAALAGSGYLLMRRPVPGAARVPLPTAAPRAVAAAPIRPTAAPEPTSPPTSEMSDARFKEEVSRRVAAELGRLESEIEQQKIAARRAADAPKKSSAAPAAPAPPARDQAPPPTAAASRTETTPAPVESALSAPGEADRPAPEPTAAEPVPAPASPPPATVMEEPPKIRGIVKPAYPPAALRARIGGTVVLRVLVSETGSPIQIDVVRGVTGGLTEAATSAVRRWTFEPARRNGVAVQGWTTVPIPFQP
jgi:TonB family protein